MRDSLDIYCSDLNNKKKGFERGSRNKVEELDGYTRNVEDIGFGN